MTGAYPNKTGLLIFFSDYTRPRGGEKYLYELSRRLHKKYQIELFVEHISPEWSENYAALHIPVHVLWSPKNLYWLFLPLTLLKNFFSLRKRIKKNDVLFGANFPLSFLTTLLSPKTIIFCFEPFNIFYDKTFIRSLPRWSQIFLSLIGFLYKPLDFLAARRAALFGTLNSSLKKIVVSRYKRGVDIYIPNGVDTHFFTPSSRPLYPLQKAGALVIGHSTDYTPLKGTEYLLRALPAVVRQKNSVLLLISETVNNPTQRQKYTRLAARLNILKYIRFVGTVPQKKLPRFYTTCDVFCFCGSSHCVGAYTASLSVLEAQACGIPVLRTVGNKEEIIEGKTGYFIIPEDPLAFAERILLFARLSRKRREKMQQTAEEHAGLFSWEQSAANLDRAVQKIIVLQN